jgi:antitoxin (DNA-binding transcriptional repressor) of toxin-antitoxin stability system
MKARPNRKALREPKTLELTDLQTTCSKVFAEIASRGTEFVITKNGVPIARITPTPKPGETLFGRYKDIITIHGDIVYFDSSEDWGALR